MSLMSFFTREAAALPAPLQNPATKYRHWFHGTNAQFGNATHDNPGGHLDHERDEDDGDYGEAPVGSHWNLQMGTHFTSVHGVAERFASGDGVKYRTTPAPDSRVAHVRLHMANPKHYDSEFEMDEHAHRWAADNHLTDFDHDDIDGLEPEEHHRALALQDSRDEIAHGFREYLESKGHDGVTYGNEHETPRGHTCAIAFHPHQINMDRWEWRHPSKEHMNEPGYQAPAPHPTQPETLPFHSSLLQHFAAGSGFSRGNRFAERLDDTEENEPYIVPKKDEYSRDHVAPGGQTYRLLHGVDGANTVSAHQQMSNGKYRGAGYLQWFGGKVEHDGSTTDGGTIYKVHVSAPHRRRGLASAMLDFAREKRPELDIRHSTALTEDGAAWAGAKASLHTAAEHDWRMQHKAPGEDDVALHDIHHEYPEVISHPEYYGVSRPGPVSRYYSHVEHAHAMRGYEDAMDSHQVMKRAQGNPDAQVHVYRAVPKHIDTIHKGDWTTLSPGYAQTHGDSNLDPDYKILKAKVPAKHVNWNMDSMDEFGYNGPDVKGTEHTTRKPALPWHDDEDSQHLGSKTGPVNIYRAEHRPPDDDLAHPTSVGVHWTTKPIDFGYAHEPGHKRVVWHGTAQPEAIHNTKDRFNEGEVVLHSGASVHVTGRTERLDRLGSVDVAPDGTPEHPMDIHVPVKGTRIGSSLLQHFAEYDYRMHHQSPDTDYGAPMHNVEDGMMPDFYAHPEYYHNGSPHDSESIAKIRHVKDRPEAKVQVYRAVPHGVKHINPGDWVTPAKSYAQEHGAEACRCGGDMNIITAKIPAKHLQTEGDVNEWGYTGDTVKEHAGANRIRMSCPKTAGSNDPYVGVTGPKSETYDYMRNNGGMRHVEGFGQEHEPWGTYMSHDEHGTAPEGYEQGSVTFQHPLHVDHADGGWKQSLSEAYGGATGKDLTRALQAAGHDAVITHDGKYGIGEMVALHTHGKTAGANGDLPDGLRHQVYYRHDPTSGERLPEGSALAVTHWGADPVAHMRWNYHTEPAHVQGIEVHPDYQRRGIGTALFNYVKENHQSDLEHSDLLTEDGKGFRSSFSVLVPGYQHEHEWLPKGKVFAPTRGGLDPVLFDEKRKMVPDVRRVIFKRLDRVLGAAGYPDWAKWAVVSLTGSEASEWWGNHDFDTMFGIDYDGYKTAHPEDADLDGEAISDKVTDVFRHSFNDEDWVAPWDGEVWHLTCFSNPGAYDVRDIQPYAAYDMTHDDWAVEPVKVAADWGPEHWPEGTWDMLDSYLKLIEAIEELPHPEQERQGANLYDWLHGDRRRAFSDHGTGWADLGNVIWKALDLHPSQPLTQLVEWKHDEQADPGETEQNRPWYDETCDHPMHVAYSGGHEREGHLQGGPSGRGGDAGDRRVRQGDARPRVRRIGARLRRALAIGDGPHPGPLTWHSKARKEYAKLDKPAQKSVQITIEALQRGDDNLQTHDLRKPLDGWCGTKASRGHRIVHQRNDENGLHVGAISLHDYGDAERRLGALVPMASRVAAVQDHWKVQQVPMEHVMGSHSMDFNGPFRDAHQMIQEKPDGRQRWLNEDIARRGVQKPIHLHADPEPGQPLMFVNGHHRASAAALAGHSHVPAVIHQPVTDEHGEVDYPSYYDHEDIFNV